MTIVERFARGGASANVVRSRMERYIMICPRTVCPNHDPERTQITGARSRSLHLDKIDCQTTRQSRRFDQRIIRRNHPR